LLDISLEVELEGGAVPGRDDETPGRRLEAQVVAFATGVRPQGALPGLAAVGIELYAADPLEAFDGGQVGILPSLYQRVIIMTHRDRFWDLSEGVGKP
jgi:hypothetical protein